MQVEDPSPLRLQQDGPPSRPSNTPAGKEAFDLWIEAGHTEKHYWLDLWRFRELLFILAWRDLAVRYKQSVAGVAWAVLQPLIQLLAFAGIFGGLADLPSSGGAPYAIMVCAGMLPWQFFSTSFSGAGQSIVGNANMISKIYFPRIIIPASSVIVSLADFLVSLLILAGLMVWYHFLPTWRLLTLPFFTAIAILTATGSGLIITALMVRYRDLRIVVPFIIQIGLFLSPVPYSAEVMHQKIGDSLFLLYSLNPLVGVIEGFRWAILGGDAAFFNVSTLLSIVVSALLFAGGVAFFRKTERHFADII